MNDEIMIQFDEKVKCKKQKKENGKQNESINKYKKRFFGKGEDNCPPLTSVRLN